MIWPQGFPTEPWMTRDATPPRVCFSSQWKTPPISADVMGIMGFYGDILAYNWDFTGIEWDHQQMWQSMDWFMGIYWNMFRLWDIAAEPTLSLCFFDQLYFWLIELLNLAAPVSKLHIFIRWTQK
jgi:hypothetical protein